MPRASVIVPCRDSGATLGRTLDALAAQTIDEDYEVIVVDDGSTDDSAAIAESYGEPIRMVRQERLGPGPARNRGVAESTGELLAFTDSDCFPEPDWLAAGVAALAEADLVQGWVHPDPNAERGPFDRTIWIDFENGLYETANLFVRRELFESVGGFESWLEPEVGKDLAEDIWFGWRARRAGARTAFAPEARARHAVFPRGAAEMIAERRRATHFADIAEKIPEIRDEVFFAGVFLSKRSAQFDLAALALLAAIRRRSKLPLLAALPYAATIARRALPWGDRAPQVAAAEVAADAVGLAALIKGSLRSGSLVL